MAAIVHIGSVAIPIDNLPQMVDQYTQFATDNPSLVGYAFFADLPLRPLGGGESTLYHKSITPISEGSAMKISLAKRVHSHFFDVPTIIP